MLGMSAASIFVYVLTAVCLTIHDATKVTYDGSGIEFAVHYDVDNCTENPGLKGWKDYLVPCGLSSRLYVVIAPCPAMPRDPSCWDPINDGGYHRGMLIGTSSAGPAPLHSGCPVYGVCLPTERDMNNRVFRTKPFQVPAERQPGQYLIATAYFHMESSWDDWTMQKDLPMHVSFSAAGRGPVAIMPYFSAIAEGKIFSAIKFPVPEFDGHHTLYLYLPPACVENSAACAKAKIVIVTDGDWWFETPELARKLLARADSLIMERRASPFILVGVPQALTFNNGSAWGSCSRTAMYTPGPCPEAWAASMCAKTDCYGQADLYLEYLAKRVLPWVSANYHGAGMGQKTAIVGFSLGGLVSCYAAWARPDIFDAAGCSSPSFWYPQEDMCRPNVKPTLNGTYFSQVAMTQYPPPMHTRLYVSDGTSEENCMGGSSRHPGPIPLSVQAMKDAGMGDFPFEQNEGFRHDPLMGWILDTLWRSLETIVPYERSHVKVAPSLDILV